MTRRVRELVTLIGLAAVGIVVGGYILSQQTSFRAPAWLPFVGEDVYTVEAEFASAQAVVPGQGQPVTVAGIRIGLVGAVTLRDGRAVVRMDIDEEHAPIHRDARLVLRPRTPLKDMTVALDRGTPEAGDIPEGGLLPVARTTPDISVDEVLASLDGDTRAYLQLLLEAAATGLGTDAEGRPDPERVDDLRAALRRFEPLARDTRRITERLARRRAAVRGVVSGWADVAGELGRIDRELTTWVAASNQALSVLAGRDDDVRAALERFPGALTETRRALDAAEPLADTLASTTRRLRPFARELPDALAATRTLARETTPIVRDDLRPLAREVRPAVADLRSGTEALADVTPDAARTFRVVRDLFQALSFNPPGDEEGYLFWAAWLGHIGANVVGVEDAHGPIVRGLPLLTCPQLEAVAQIEAGNETLEALIKLSNLPDRFALCPNQIDFGALAGGGATR